MAAAGTVVLTGVATGVVVNILSAQAQKILPQTSPTFVVAPPPSPEASHAIGSARSKSLSQVMPLTVLSEVSLNDFGHDWTFPHPTVLSSPQLTYLNDALRSPWSAYDLWFSNHGAYADAADTQVVFRNNRSYPVRILNITADKTCSAPLHGTLVYEPDAGADDSIRLGFDLTSLHADAEASKGWDPSQWVPNYFDRYTVSIQPHTQQVFSLRAVPGPQSCVFRYDVSVLDGDKTVHQILGDNGEPFRVTGPPAGEPGDSFSQYKILYLSGIASPGHIIRANPMTYH